MMKLTNEQLTRSAAIFAKTFDYISQDLDTLEDFRPTNRNCHWLCLDYIGRDAGEEAYTYVSELAKEMGGWDVLIRALCRHHRLV
jgi:hypothetical protein